MQMILKIITIFMLVSLNVHAQENSEAYNSLNMHEKKDYDFVINTCHKNIESLATLFKSTTKDTGEYFYYIYLDTTDLPIKDNLSTRRGLGKNTHRLLHSEGYYQGLMTCFPKSEQKRNLYTMNLLLLDAYGKITAMSIVGIVGTSVYKGLAFLGRKIAIPPTVTVFKKLNASDKFIEKLPKFMGKTGVYGINALTIGIIANYVYKLKKDKELINPDSKIKSDKLRKDLKRNIELYHQTLKLKSEARNSAEQIAMETLLKEQKQIIEFYLDSLLKEKNLNPEEKKDLLAFKEFLEKSV